MHYFRLAEAGGALFNADGGVVRPGNSNASKELGWEVDLATTVKPGRHHAILVDYSYFFAGQFLEDTGPSSDIDFFYARYKFMF